MKKPVFLPILFLLITCFSASAQQKNVVKASTVVDPIAERLYNQALQAIDEDNFGKAYSLLTESNKNKVNFEAALFNLGWVCIEIKKYPEAVSSFSKVLEIVPGETDALYGRGLAHLLADSLDVALKDFEAAFNINYQFGNAYRGAGNVMLKKQEYAKAIGYFSEAIKNNAKDIEALNGRAIAYRQLGKNQEAVSDYNTILGIEKNKEYLINRGNTYLEMNESYNAYSDYTEAIKSDSLAENAYIYRAVSLINMEQYEEAEKDFDKAIALDAINEMIYNNRGNLRIKQNKYKDAINDYSHAIEINPDYAVAYLNRGIAKELIRDEQGACDDYAKAVEIGGEPIAEEYKNQCITEGFLK